MNVFWSRWKVKQVMKFLESCCFSYLPPYQRLIHYSIPLSSNTRQSWMLQTAQGQVWNNAGIIYVALTLMSHCGGFGIAPCSESSPRPWNFTKFEAQIPSFARDTDRFFLIFTPPPSFFVSSAPSPKPLLKPIRERLENTRVHKPPLPTWMHTLAARPSSGTDLQCCWAVVRPRCGVTERGEKERESARERAFTLVNFRRAPVWRYYTKRTVPTENPLIRPWEQRSEEAQKQKATWWLSSRPGFHLGLLGLFLHVLMSRWYRLISFEICLLLTGAPLCAGFAQIKTCFFF